MLRNKQLTPYYIFRLPCPPLAKRGSLTHSQALALSKRARDVTAPPVALNRYAIRLAGHQSPRQVSYAGWDRMANEKGTSASIAVQYRLTHQHTKRYLLHIPYLQVCTKINHFFYNARTCHQKPLKARNDDKDGNDGSLSLLSII